MIWPGAAGETPGQVNGAVPIKCELVFIKALRETMPQLIIIHIPETDKVIPE